MNYKRIHRHYAYTLQGWLKDINGYRVDINSTGVYDIGEDGSNTNYVNKRFGRDLFSSMIQFYQTDYSPISGNNYFNLVSTNSIDLYNGNISAISVGIKNLDPLLKSYCYDKINRIKEMKSAGLNNNVWGTLSNLFGSTYSYDFNGNIDTLIRYDQNGNLLHSIRYTYSADRNRLSSINVTGTGIGSSSYQYDALGNLIRDNNENINVTWNVIGKVKSVQTPNNILSFAYNPFGQRQIKRTASDSTYYIHDATGNVMSIYVKDYPKIIAKERPIYGSSRLGIMNKEVEFNLTGNFLSKSNSTIGIKEYELSDHLGNVSVVVLDRKECSISVIKPIVKTYTDYYPFGYPISSRTDNVDYRYGFNGQEGDDEIYGDAKSYTAEYWQYDSRLGRRWNLDPIIKTWESPYSTFANNPIKFRDILGADTVFDDNVARQGFMERYNEVLNTISQLEDDFYTNKFKLIVSDNLSKKEIQKTKKLLKNAEESLGEWEKVKQDFDDIINSKVKVHYDSNTDNLRKNEMGVTWKSFLEGNGSEMTGYIYVSIRPGYSDFFIHEHRHVNRKLTRTNLSKTLDREREAYYYQSIINPEGVQKIIENARNIEYSSPQNRPFDYSLDDMIRFIYKDDIEKEQE